MGPQRRIRSARGAAEAVRSASQGMETHMVVAEHLMEENLLCLL